MDRCEKLRDNLYGVDLLTGSITPVKEHIALIFYIVNNTDNGEFVENEALQMITQFGKTEYHFCGRHSELWQRIFNDTALKIYPTDSEKVITRKYESTEKFADELRRHCRKNILFRPTFILFMTIKICIGRLWE